MKKKFFIMLMLFSVFLTPFVKAQTTANYPIIVEINDQLIKQSLSGTRAYYSDEARPDILTSRILVNLPGIDGASQAFRIIETPVLSKSHNKDYPDIKSYSGISTDGKVGIKFSMTNLGFTGVLIKGGSYYYIEKLNNGNEYQLFPESQIPKGAVCENIDESAQIDQKKLRAPNGTLIANGASLRNFTMAIAATGEFTAQNGGTKVGANAKINALLTLINAKYEQELSMTFTLAATNDNIIFLNAATDPFSPTASSSANASQTAFTSSLNTAAFMPYANYDIGHTLNYYNAGLTGGSLSASGQAGPTPCTNTAKSRAWTQYSEGTVGNASAAFITSIMIHEMGHQFGAGHTFNGNGNNCAAGTGQYSTTSGYEPGSGTTIMSYQGICSSTYNLTGPEDDYFHAISIQQIFTAISGSSGTCADLTSTGNAVPTANAGADFTIPKGTPFVLNGTGSDANAGDILTYTWDQYDAPVSTGQDQGALGQTNGIGGYNAVNSTTAPLFRSKQAATGERLFPALPFILNNANNPADNEGEDLANVSRVMDFRLIVRDNKLSGGGAFATDDVAITVAAGSGPFEITSFNSATLWFAGSSQTLTWAVNNTNIAPVNCTNVKISISTNGGTSFSTLVASTPNDGSYVFTVPNTPSSNVRIKIESVGNIFFDINNVNITISNGTCLAENATITDASTLNLTAGNIGLNLNLSVVGNLISSLSGTVSGTSNSTNLTVKDLSGNCLSFSNSPLYELPSFKTNGAANITFSVTGTLGNRVMNLYENSYDNGNVCNNWLNSSGTYNGSLVNLSSNMTGNLASNSQYFIKISGFNPGQTGTFTITPSGGSIYAIVPAAGSAYAYTYLVYDFNTGLITGFDDSPNLSSYNAGSYRVYGLSYPGGASLSQYVNTSFSSFQTAITNGSICAKLSSNNKIVNITCASLPAAPGVNSPTIAYNTSAALTATGCIGGSINWFTTVSGGSSFFTGPSYNTPNLISNTNYYVECNLAGCISATRGLSTVTVGSSPCANSITLVSPANDISGGIVNIETNNNSAITNDGLIEATNDITGGNVRLNAGKKVVLMPGFSVNGSTGNMAVFTAEIGGCSN